MGITIVPKTGHTNARHTVKKIKGTPKEKAMDKEKKRRTQIEAMYSTEGADQPFGNKKPSIQIVPINEELKPKLLNERMGGGKVYKRKAGGGVKTGKVIKTNMTGEQLVAACYG